MSEQPPTPRKSLWMPVFGMAALVEIPTLIARFGLGLESTRDTAATVGRFTFGIRIHHGYIGVLLLIVAGFWKTLPHPWKRRVLILGGGLLLSDLLHHFVFLWSITGSPQFDLFYP